VHGTVERVRVAPSPLDLLLTPLHRWVWLDAHRRGKKLLRFAETEDAGGRDLCRGYDRRSARRRPLGAAEEKALRVLFEHKSASEMRAISAGGRGGAVTVVFKAFVGGGSVPVSRTRCRCMAISG
jgi:hypothetical protein